MTKDKNRDAKNGDVTNHHHLKHRDSIAGRYDDRHRVIHDAELGEENVELVDSDWADFEKALRYDHYSFGNFQLRYSINA